MIRRTIGFFFLTLFSCSGGSNSLTGSLSQVYDLSFDSVVITGEGAPQPTNVKIAYTTSGGGYPAILVVDVANIANIAGSSISLVDIDPGTHQERGTLQNVSAGGTNNLPIELGSVVFDQVPKFGATLSGHFASTLSNPSGYTLNGDFTGTVNQP